MLAGRPDEEIGPNVGGGDDSWDLDRGETVELLAEGYRRACERSRQTAARFSLDDAVAHRRLGQVSLRWIYVHMIEETARHSGTLTSCASRPTVPLVWTASWPSIRELAAAQRP